MKIVWYHEEEKADTGIIAEVFPFDGASFGLVVRPDCVDVDGSAFMGPAWVRIFADALRIAADIAEGKYNEQTSRNDQIVGI